MKLFRRISFGLLTLTGITLAIITVIEKLKGTEFVRQYIYDSDLFIVLWGLLSIFGLVYIIQQKRYKVPFTFLIHIAFLVILLGAFLTWTTGIKGGVHLRTGKVTTHYIDNSKLIHEFPFSLELKEFTVNNYPGTITPQDYISRIEIKENVNLDQRFQAKVSLNNIVKYKGYRFYQTSFDDDMKGSQLSISYDPYGVPVTYFGYGLLLCSMFLFFFSKKSDFRKLLKSHLLKNTLLLCILSLTLGNANATNEITKPKVLPQAQAEQFCDLYVLYNGRICPLQTLAKDFTLKLYGKDTYKGFSAEQIFTGWLFYYPSWSNEKMIKIKRQYVKNILGVNEKYVALKDFFDEKNQNKLKSSLLKIYKGESIKEQKSIREADEKFNLIVMLYSGQIAKIYPHKEENLGINWYAQNSKLVNTIDNKKILFIRKTEEYLKVLANKNDYAKFSDIVQKIKKYQKKEAGAQNLPSKGTVKAEKIYNNSNYIKFIFIVFLTLGTISFAYFIRTLLTKQKIKKTILLGLNLFLISGFIYLTIYISLRGIISQHFPVSNGYETMQFLAWSSLLATLILQAKFKMVIPFGYLLSGLSLLVSTLSQNSPQITPLMPVLSSPLLSIHVATIMISYLLFAFIMLNGIAGLILYLIQKDISQQIERLQIISQIILIPAVFLLITGTFIGAIWANISWGAYWSWDPKEVWALITIIVYSFPIHTTSLKKYQNAVYFHSYSVLSFLTVLVTYFGVNYILGGMHSYVG